MLRSGRLLPGLMSAPWPVSMTVALLQVVRREDVALLAVGVVQQRDAAVRLGSYSMCATLAGTPSLS
jgi:hypothetical protein